MKAKRRIVWLVVLLLMMSTGIGSLNVKGENSSASLTFSKKTDTLKAGKSFIFKVEKTNIASQVEYKVSDSNIASISANGKLTGKRMGTVTVYAVTQDAVVKTKVKILPKKVVAIDPGHSAKIPAGTEPEGPGSSIKKAKDAIGTCGVSTKVPEYKLTLTLAKQLKTVLENRGYQVILTRTDNNTAISCTKRAQIANKAGADIFLRIHADGISSSSVHGASALYPTKNNKYISKLSDKSKKLSSCILNAMCQKSGAYNRGLSGRDDLTGSNWAKMPVTLIEVGFMTNPAEDKKMQKKSYQKKLVKGMAQGIDNYFGYE